MCLIPTRYKYPFGQVRPVFKALVNDSPVKMYGGTCGGETGVFYRVAGQLQPIQDTKA